MELYYIFGSERRAGVTKLADESDSKSEAERRAGSSPASGNSPCSAAKKNILRGMVHEKTRLGNTVFFGKPD